MKFIRQFACLLWACAILTVLAGCAGTPPKYTTPETPPTASQSEETMPVGEAVPPIITEEETELKKEPPRPKINLTGFPLPYRQGYHDGCASAQGTEQKNEGRFAKDADYRLGWLDGFSLCQPKE
jgi:hypothetical protein